MQLARWPSRVALAFTLAAAWPAPVRAGDVTAFVAFPSPSEAWQQGFGAALSSTWFQVLSLEGEAARVRGELPETSMTTFTASAMIAPPIGGLIPYGGLGIGLFRQTVGTATDTGTVKAFILGVKIRIKNLIVLKGEYRDLDLPDDSPLFMDKRWSVGAGIAF